jgi:hypothetical protein
MRIRNLLLITLTVMTATAAGVLARNQLRNRHAEFKPYTITWQVTDYDESGAVSNQYTETRYTARDGRWYSVRHFLDGKRQETFSVPGKGVFVRGKEKLMFLSEAPEGPPRTYTDEQVSKSPAFLHTEEVLGVQVVVMKGGPGDSTEVYLAPGLNYDWVKRVERGENGVLRSTVEPVSIVMGDPDLSVFKPVDLPVDRSFYEKKKMQQQTPPR